MNTKDSGPCSGELLIVQLTMLNIQYSYILENNGEEEHCQLSIDMPQCQSWPLPILSLSSAQRWHFASASSDVKYNSVQQDLQKFAVWVPDRLKCIVLDSLGSDKIGYTFPRVFFGMYKLMQREQLLSSRWNYSVIISIWKHGKDSFCTLPTNIRYVVYIPQIVQMPSVHICSLVVSAIVRPVVGRYGYISLIPLS